MPTSATGRIREGLSGRSRGFTLVEMMVVLAIVGLMAAVVAVNVPSSESTLARESDRLAARLLAARDHAILANRGTSAILDARGYRFVERQGKTWKPLADAPLADAAWRGGTVPLLPENGEIRIGFDSVGMSEAQTLTLMNDDRRAVVRVLGSGEVRVDAGA
ncbi:GspH/FimT family pseudopilin [Sphingosinicella soli]|uniref:Type II secretion system protein H n=1 Tax=Sphingosinicella soli TaxID=333708 RepID=A0A7W7F6N5_9SPHN|nr:GspH/FimT family pseudopilin [Sphingosinicella soli]MBB4631924.1 general secretion pathway protein H [Sphingosinicella soli]